MAYIGNFLLTRLAQNLDQSSTSMTVTSGDGAKFGAEMIRLYGAEMFPYYLIIRSQAYGQAVLDPNREIVQVTARDEDTFTIVRGTRGTTAVAHYSGDYVQLSLQADDLIFPETTVRRLDPNLCLYLPFEEGTGTKTKDLSGWGNHGTLVNGPTWTTGRAGKCLSFDGVDDYVDCGNSASLNMTDEITIELWINRISYAMWNDLISHATVTGESDSTGQSFRLEQWDTTNTLGFVSNAGIPGVFPFTFSSGSGNGVWVHIAITGGNGLYTKAYVNGELKVQSSTVGGKINLVGDGWYIGSRNTNKHFSNCLIDEVRIYNRALSASEIQDHYLNP